MTLDVHAIDRRPTLTGEQRQRPSAQRSPAVHAVRVDAVEDGSARGRSTSPVCPIWTSGRLRVRAAPAPCPRARALWRESPIPGWQLAHGDGAMARIYMR